MHACDLSGLKASHCAWDVVTGAMTYRSPSIVVVSHEDSTGLGHHVETRW